MKRTALLLNTPLKKLLTTLLLTLIMLPPFTAFGQAEPTRVAPAVRYFRNVDIDRTHQFAFTHEIFGKDTLRVKHYRVYYDSLARITEWQFRVAGKLEQDMAYSLGRVKIDRVGDTITYRYYDEYDHPTPFPTEAFTGSGQYGEKIFRHPSGKYFTVILTDRAGKRVKSNHEGCSGYQCFIDSLGRVIRKYCLDEKNRRTINTDSTYEIQYSVDENGFLGEIRAYDQNGKRSFRKTITNDQDGQPLQQLWRDDPVDTSLITYTYEYAYDSNSYWTQMAEYGVNERLIKLKLYEWDEFGNNLIWREYDENHELTLQTQFTYDSAHQYLGKLLSNETDGVFYRDSLVHDQEGRTIEEWYFTNAHALVRHKDSVTSVLHFYKDGFRDVESHYRNYLGELIPGRLGVARVRMFKDKWGETIEIRYMDAQGRPNNSPRYDAASIQYFYSESGKTINAKTFDVSGNEVPYHDKRDDE